MHNALTIDLEDWYQGLTSTSQQVKRWPEFEDRVVESTGRLLAILERASTRATFFVLGYVAEQHPDLVRLVAEAGHEIALHGYHHYRVSGQTPHQFRDEILRGRQAVAAASGQGVLGYRAPMFSINGSALWALDILREEGFLYDSSVFPTRNMLYGYPDAPRFPYRPLDGNGFVEFPLSTVRVFGVNLPVAGGFYLRVLPYRLFRWGLRQLEREGMPAILYLHPWELDPDHPQSWSAADGARSNPTLREKFTHYHNLQNTGDKLIALLRDFRFGPLRELLNDAVLAKGR